MPSASNETVSTVGGRRSWLEASITRCALVAGDVAAVFDFVAAEDVLPKVLTGYGVVPGVLSTSGMTGPWDRPGSKRTVHLVGGSTAQEALTTYEAPNYFSYRVSDPTFALRFLMREARGQWWLNTVNGGTQVRWTYTFRAKGVLSLIPLLIFARTQWAGYMDVCLRNVTRHFVQQLEPSKQASPAGAPRVAR